MTSPQDSIKKGSSALADLIGDVVDLNSKTSNLQTQLDSLSKTFDKHATISSEITSDLVKDTTRLEFCFEDIKKSLDTKFSNMARVVTNQANKAACWKTTAVTSAVLCSTGAICGLGIFAYDYLFTSSNSKSLSINDKYEELKNLFVEADHRGRATARALATKQNDDYYELSNTIEKLIEGHKHDIDNLLELFGNYEDMESKVDLNTEEIVDLQTKYQNLTLENSKLWSAIKEQNEKWRRFEEAKHTLEAHITQMDNKIKYLEDNQKALEDRIDDLTSKHVNDINELTQEINNTVKNEYFERMLNYVLDGQQTIIAEIQKQNDWIDLINTNTNSTLDYFQEQLSFYKPDFEGIPMYTPIIEKVWTCDSNTLLGTEGNKPEIDSNCKLLSISTKYPQQIES